MAQSSYGIRFKRNFNKKYLHENYVGQMLAHRKKVSSKNSFKSIEILRRKKTLAKCWPNVVQYLRKNQFAELKYYAENKHWLNVGPTE